MRDHSLSVAARALRLSFTNPSRGLHEGRQEESYPAGTSLGGKDGIHVTQLTQNADSIPFILLAIEPGHRQET
jgi:hypothetical protein